MKNAWPMVIKCSVSGLSVEEVPEEQGALDPEAASLIKKIQKICAKFRRSPLQNDELQEEIKALFGAEYQLKIECATRWGSILIMLKRFNKVRDPLDHALVDLRQKELFPTQSELDKIDEMVEALDIVECCSRLLCGRDVSLSDADWVRVTF